MADGIVTTVWLYSSLIWLPLAIYPVFRKAKFVDKWESEDQRAETPQVGPWVAKSLLLSAAASPLVIIALGLFFSWNFGVWMAAWTVGSITFLLLLKAATSTEKAGDNKRTK